MQGCVASPLLFTLYIADIVQLLKNSGISGVNLNDLYELHLFLFADDMVLLASSARALQLKINLLKGYFEGLGLKINVVKTKIVIYRRGGKLPANIAFQFGNKELEIVKEYRYLGIVFSSSCLFRKAAEDAKRKGMMALGSTWKLFQNCKIDAWKTHQKLFNSLVASTTVYGSHIWGPNYKDVIDKVQSHFIPRLLHLDFKTPTYALRLETKTQKLILTVRKQQINFVIRLLQMPASRLVSEHLN
jgi:hypothetical protein